MRIPIAAAVLFSLAFSPQARGVVSKVTTGPVDATATVQFTVEGTNPCGAVHLDYGDGAVIVHAISALPVTIPYEYTRVGEFLIQAKGMGNCDGVANTRVRVDRVRPQRQDPPPPPDPVPPTAMRFKEMDDNGDGVITRAEWRGSLQSFNVHDWNGDRQLSGDEVRVGARHPGERMAVTAIVDSREGWTETGVTVRRGDTLIFDATGTIYFSTGSPATGPEGARGRRAPAGSPMPRELIGALIARVGRSAPLLVGAGAEAIRAPVDGPLYLRINDDVLDDNRGEFRVVISVTRTRLR